MARNERSAGVVVFHRDEKGVLIYLLLDYGRYWDYAKGHVERGESDLMAASRELHEETGLRDVDFIPGFSHEIAYFFRHPKKGLIHKTVVFFLAETQGIKVTISDEHVGYAFLPFSEALTRLTYPSARQILQKADEFLSSEVSGQVTST